MIIKKSAQKILSEEWVKKKEKQCTEYKMKQIKKMENTFGPGVV